MSNNFEENKKKILDEQETDLKADRESSEPLLLTDELKAEGIEMISFSKKYLYVEDCNGHSVHVNLFKDSISRTLEYFENLVNSTFDNSLKKAIKLFIAEIWDEKIKDNRTSGNGEGDNDKPKERSTKAELVIPRIKLHIHQLFIDEYDVPHAGITINNHVEVLRLDSRRFRNWMARKTYLEEGHVIDSSTLKDIIGILSAQAEFESPRVSLALRVANIDGSWYYDLTNEEWEFIQITPEGWYTVKNCVVFRRYNSKPQAHPSMKYSPDILDRFIGLLNIQGDENRLLLKCYIVSLFIPDIPKVALILSGEQGSAKTTLEELIKMLVDPSPIRTCSFPRDVTEFIQQLAHNYLAAYDNISVIRDWVSDLLCRAITGSGFSKRELYTTDSDFIYNIMRCILLNGITIAATKADLLDRSLIIQLQDITDDKRRKIEDLWKEFNEIKSELLGYIFDLLAKVLEWKKQHGSPNITLFRMADWTEYGEIIARCMGHQDNEFLKAYNKNIGFQLDEVISSSPVATALINYIVSKDSNFDFETTATEWLTKLTEYAEAMGIDTRYKSWPKSGSYLSRRLKELEKTLRDIGINIEWSKTPDTRARLINIRKVSSMSSVSSGNSNQARNSEHKEGIAKDMDDTDDTLHTFKAEGSSQQEPPPDEETEDEDILSKLMKDNPDPRPPGYNDSKQ